MRITHRMIIDNAIRSMSDNLDKLGELQTKASSGKSFTKSSEAPHASRVALALKSHISENSSYLESMSSAENWLTASNLALDSLGDLASQAINSALEGISDTNEDARAVLAVEIDKVIEDAISEGNTKYGENYLFSGHQVNTPPFRFVSGVPDSVAYDGDAGLIQRAVGQDQAVTVNFTSSSTISPLFDAMIAARDALLAGDTTALQSAVDDLRSAKELISNQSANNGVKINQLEQNQTYLEETQLSLEGLLSREEDIDLVEVISELRHQETIYQSVLQVGQRTLATVNLFDLMK